MKTPSRFDLARLSRRRYADFLQLAKDRGFAFVRFRDFLPDAAPLPERYIALRHDVDFAPRYALEMAELEHAAGVVSTFHVLVDGQHYDATSKAVVEQIRSIHALGHEVGLHWALSSAVHEDLAEEVAFRLRLLTDIVGAPVRSYSQHDTVNAGLAGATVPAGHEPCVEASTAIREHDLLYVSDSAMMWRQHTFESALDEGRSLCLLAHSHSWLHPEDDYIAMIRDLEAQEVERVTARFDAFVDALTRYYERRLEEGV